MSSPPAETPPRGPVYPPGTPVHQDFAGDAPGGASSPPLSHGYETPLHQPTYDDAHQVKICNFLFVSVLSVPFMKKFIWGLTMFHVASKGVGGRFLSRFLLNKGKKSPEERLACTVYWYSEKWVPVPVFFKKKLYTRHRYRIIATGKQKFF